MTETAITILVNRKSDFDLIRQKLIDSKIQFPVYIFELDSHLKIEFISDYEEWELDSKILTCFPNYEFTDELEKGRKEIRIQISRYQSKLSIDDWGRPIENPLNETKYLIKKTASDSEIYNPNVKVLFGNKEENYFVNIVEGINNSTNEKGFLLVNIFKSSNEKNNTEILKEKIFKTYNEAFRFGYNKMQNTVSEDFKIHVAEKKKLLTEQHKVPKKVVRNFIASCNKFDIVEILKTLDNNFVFEKRIKSQTIIMAEGIQHFEKYLKSPTQDLCSMDFKIRTQWTITLPKIEIGVKYYPKEYNKQKNDNLPLKYRQFSFRLNNDKITSIIEEQ